MGIWGQAFLFSFRFFLRWILGYGIVNLVVEARPNSGRAFCFGDAEWEILASLVAVHAAVRSFSER